MKTFIINLPSAKERLYNISKQLNEINIKYEIFPAIYGKDLKEDEINNYYDDEKAKEYLGKSLSKGEIGCALSHMLIYKKIIKENIDIALILEDDANISKKITNLYNKINNSGTNRDYISLNYGLIDKKEIKRYTKFTYNEFYKKGKKLKFLLHIIGMIIYSFIDYSLIFISKIIGTFIIKKYKPSYLTGGYIITKKGAEKLLKIHNKVFVPSDYLPEKFGNKVNLKFSVSVPRLVIQNTNFDSCIDSIEKRE